MKRSIKFLLFSFLLFSCINNKNETNVLKKPVINSTDYLFINYNEILNLLIFSNKELYNLTINKLISNNETKKFNITSKLAFQNYEVLLKIDTQLDYLHKKQFPSEHNFIYVNNLICEYNDIISEDFIFSNELESKVMIKPIDYELVKKYNVSYLIQKKIKILISTNILYQKLLSSAHR